MDRPLHGGSVSPWPRRARRLGHWCVGTFSTLVLAALVAIVALACADALGAMGPLVVSIALLVSFVLLCAMLGLAPLTLAVACALAVVTVSHYWLALDLLVVLGAAFERIVH